MRSGLTREMPLQESEDIILNEIAGSFFTIDRESCVFHGAGFFDMSRVGNVLSTRQPPPIPPVSAIGLPPCRAGRLTRAGLGEAKPGAAFEPALYD